MAGQPQLRRPTTLEIARRFPVTSTLIVINLLVYATCAFATMKAHRGSALDFDPPLLLSWGADFGPLTLDRQWWRLFTSMFLHGGLLHVAANMWCLWSLGPLAERIYGRYRYLIIYLLTGLGSSLASLALHPVTISVGASGAIFGIVGSLVFPFYRKRVILPGPVMKNIMRSLGMFIIVNLAIGTAIPVIDNAAHIGGLLVGLALGAIITHFATSGADLQAIFPKVTVATLLLLGFGFAGLQRLHEGSVLPEQSHLALQAGDNQTALNKAKRAVERYPRNALAYLALGDVYFTTEKYSDAVHEYESAHKLNPKDAYTAERLGMAYMMTDQMQKSEPLLKQALADNPDDARLLESVGVVLAAREKFDEALGYLRKAIAKNPELPIANYTLGSILMDQKKYKEAAAVLREAVRLQPNNADYKKTLAEVEAKVSISAE